ncbi:MAG TPA: diaminopropionate ammonia-lyase [Gemmatimonadales bacterium]|nr:diaminopropionate ammonia-lyase [Gemmatimonadales bacterium]
MPRAILNPQVRQELRTPTPSLEPWVVHRKFPGYQPTPLRQLDDLARIAGVRAVHLKDESNRFGLPAYKILGASWATLRILERMLGSALEPWTNIDQLRERLEPLGRLKLITMTDGNHGRGVARVARWLGYTAEIFVPRGTAQARIEGIESEGAIVTVVEGTYDDAVERAASSVAPGVILVSDHGWPGFEEVPSWVAEGYETIFLEIERQIADQQIAQPDLVLVQIGVGTLATAVVAHFRAEGRATFPTLVGVEPIGAACALHSIEAGKPVMLHAGADASIMAGLNCGTPSTAAWPALEDGIDAYLAIEDERAREAMRLLAAAGVVAGESGAASTGGLLELMKGIETRRVREALEVGPDTRVLLISTEGATDPVSYGRIVGRSP